MMRKPTWFEKVFGGGLVLSVIACAGFVYWALSLSGRPVSVRNESGRPVEIVPIGATAAGLFALSSSPDRASIIQLGVGGRTEVTYDFEGTNFCWLVVFAEGEARLLKTALALSNPEKCVVDAGATRRLCCTPLPRGRDIVIPQLEELEPVPRPIVEAARHAREP